jgi:hypothetical protein
MAVFSNDGGSWLDTIAALLAKEQRPAPIGLNRRLAAERLEQRNLLCTVPAAVPVTSGGVAQAENADYFKALGPIAPTAASATPHLATQSLASGVPVAPADYFFGTFQGQGAGEGEASGSGSGAAAAGSGVGTTTASGSGSGGGWGSGSGSGSGSGVDEPPVISDTGMKTDANGNFIASGCISDDDGVGNLSFTLDGATGTIKVDENGDFSIAILDTNGNTGFTFSVTDAFGNTTTYSFQYPT